MQRFSDFDEVASFYTGWNVEVEQSSEGAFEGVIQLARTRNLYVVEGAFSRGLVVRGSSNPLESAIYLIEPQSANSVWWGRRFEPGSVVSLGPGTPAEYSSAPNTRTTGVAAPSDLLEWAKRSLLRKELPAAQPTWSAMTPSLDSSTKLGRRLRRLLAIGCADPAVLGSSEGRWLEQECLRAMVEATSPDEQSTRVDLPLSSRSALVKRAEELMRSQLRTPMGAIDLCHVLDVSDRTLRQAFQERYSIGPMVYYKQLRLNAVRTELKSSEPGRVGKIARSYGFHHLGNFSADFRRAFGHSPSTVVKSG